MIKQNKTQLLEWVNSLPDDDNVIYQLVDGPKVTSKFQKKIDNLTKKLYHYQQVADYRKANLDTFSTYVTKLRNEGRVTVEELKPIFKKKSQL